MQLRRPLVRRAALRLRHEPPDSDGAGSFALIAVTSRATSSTYALATINPFHIPKTPRMKKLTIVLVWAGEHPEHRELETSVGYCFKSTKTCDETSSSAAHGGDAASWNVDQDIAPSPARNPMTQCGQADRARDPSTPAVAHTVR